MHNVTLVVLSAVSGVPLMVKHKGYGKPPSYNFIGSLNGVLMFAESQGTQLMNTCTPGMTITWRTYHDSIRLILLHSSKNKDDNFKSTNSPSKKFGAPCDQQLLDLIFDSLVLLLSEDVLSGKLNEERLKKDVKVCTPLLDMLLDRHQALGTVNTSASIGPGPLFSQLVMCADTVLPPENYNLQVTFHIATLFSDCFFEVPCISFPFDINDLAFGFKADTRTNDKARSEVQKWSESHCNSSYSSLVSSNGRVLSASRTYWSLSPSELVLLPMLLLAAPVPNTAKDVPVYLPNKSPKVPFRLIGIKLTSQVWSLSLCGPSPTLASIMKSASLFWGPYYASIETLAAFQPYNMTASARQTLDKSVLGLMLVNYESKRCVSCVHLGPSLKKTSSPTKPPVPNTNTSPSASLPSNSNLNSLNSNKSKGESKHSNTGTSRSRKSAHSSSNNNSSQISTLTATKKTGKASKVHHYYSTVECDIGKSNIEQSGSRNPKIPTSTNTRNSHKHSIENTSTLNKEALRALSPSSRPQSAAGTSRALSPSASIQSPKPAGVMPSLSPSFKISILANVYRALAGGVLVLPTSARKEGQLYLPAMEISAGHSISEAYIWCNSCRVYILQSATQLLFVILPSALPHTLARSVSYKTLDIFMKTKAFKNSS